MTWQKMKKFQLAGLIMLFIIAFLTNTAAAQGGILVSGQVTTGEISTQTPVALYSFQGTAGGHVTLQAFGDTSGLLPALTLLAPSGTAVASSSSDPFTPGAGDARITALLPENGFYSVLVGGAQNTVGFFTLRLTLGQTFNTLTLQPGPAQSIPVGGVNGEPTLRVAGGFNATTLIGAGAVPAEFLFNIEVRSPDGKLQAVASGLPLVALTLPPANGNYEIKLSPMLGDATGSVCVGIGTATPNCGGAQTAPIQPVQPQPPATTQEVGAPPANTCVVSPGAGQVNVRSGPGTNYNVIGSLQPGQFLPVNGVYADWYGVIYNGQQGYVSSTVVFASGPCGGLPVLQPPPPPAPGATQAAPPPAQATPTYTVTPAADLVPIQTQPVQPPQATATYTYTYTPTVAAPTAPPDSNYAMNVPLDGSVSLSDFVSYPNGDTEDVVGYSVTGLNNNVALPGGQADLTLAFSCFGTGTQNVRFVVDGQTRTCGQSYVRRVNADSNTGAVRIQAFAGENTYVQWVINATAPRVN